MKYFQWLWITGADDAASEDENISDQKMKKIFPPTTWTIFPNSFYFFCLYFRTLNKTVILIPPLPLIFGPRLTIRQRYCKPGSTEACTNIQKDQPNYPWPTSTIVAPTSRDLFWFNDSNPNIFYMFQNIFSAVLEWCESDACLTPECLCDSDH